MTSSQKEAKSDYDRVYMYPKSSCNCYHCVDKDKPRFPPKSGVPTNLSVRDCKISDYYDCYDRRVIDHSEQPQKKSGKYVWINPKAYSESYSKSFAMIDCHHSQDHCDTCTEPQFGTWDPRTWSATHNQYLTFDRPPLESTPKLSEIYDKDLKNYGQNYKTYSDINAGQVIYYADPSREDPYYEPLFSQPAEVTRRMYQDPMGAMKPEYPRKVNYSNPITDNKCDYSPYCLSWIKDSQMFREDIMTSIMAKSNQQRYMPRWEPFKQNQFS